MMYFLSKKYHGHFQKHHKWLIFTLLKMTERLHYNIKLILKNWKNFIWAPQHSHPFRQCHTDIHTLNYLFFHSAVQLNMRM